MCMRSLSLLMVFSAGLAVMRPAEAGDPLEKVIALARQGWGVLGVNTATHRPDKEGRPLQIGDTVYEMGIGTHAPSTITVDLWGEYALFEAEVGIQDQPNSDGGSVIFQVFVDGEQRFDSGVMRQADPPKKVRVSLANADEMDLVVLDAGDGITCDVANWVNAFLTRTEVPPQHKARARLNIAPFGCVMTWPPEQTGAHPGRVEELDEDQIFLGRVVAPNADGTYTVGAAPGGEGCIGLQWHENRSVVELAVLFARQADAPDPQRARVQWWVGESRWQGDWKLLSGEIAAEGRRWVFRPSRKDFSAASIGVEKVRWIFPGQAAERRIEALEAYTRSRCDTAEIALQAAPPSASQHAAVTVHNGEITGPTGDNDPRHRTWDMAQPLRLNVRYCKTRPNYAKSDRTVLQLDLPDGAFGVAVEDVVEKGGVYVPDFGIFVTRGPVHVGLEEHLGVSSGDTTVLQQVRALPDQSFAQAMEHVHRDVQDRGPTMLSLACDNHKFIVNESGAVLHRFDPETGPDEDRRKAVASPIYPVEVTPRLASSPLEKRTRHIEDGWVPILTTAFNENPITCTQRAFVTPYERNAAPTASGWLNPKPLFVAEFTFKNTSTDAVDVSFALGFTIPKHQDQPVQLAQTSRGVTVCRDGRLLAFADTPPVTALNTSVQDGEMKLAGSLAPGRAERCVLYLPGWDTTAEACASLRGGADLVEDVKAYWRGVMGPAMQVEVPEPLLQDVIQASQVHCLMTARNEGRGQRISPWCGADRYGPLESESQAIIHGMGLMGHDAFARRSLDFFINRYNPDGLLTTGYTLMGMGWHLWTLADYYARSGNDAWFREVAPKLERACQWIVRQCGKTKRIEPGGAKVLEYGLVAPGVAADWSRFAYTVRLEGEFYAGVAGIARAYQAIGYPGADELCAAAEEFRDNIRRAYSMTQARSPVVALRDSTCVPYCPAIIGCFGRVWDLYPNEDGGRSWGKDMSMGAHNLVVLGVLDVQDRRRVGWITDYLEDFWCLQSGMGAYPIEENMRDWFNLGGFSKVQPYYTRLVELYAMIDDVKPFIRAYFNAVPSLLNTENLALWEHFNNAGAWNKPHETGWFLAQTRLMLLMERGEELWLAPFVTQHWMKDGMCVRVQNAPTNFGKVSYTIASHVADGFIEATIDPPARTVPEALVLRLRHPDGKPMQTVRVNGAHHAGFDPQRECIFLEPTADRVVVKAQY